MIQPAVIGAISSGYKKLNLIPANLVLSYSLEEFSCYNGSGTAINDLSSSGITGTLTNGVSYNGVYPRSLYFDGVDDYVALGTPSALNITGNLTISAWLKIDTYSGFDTIYSKGYDGTNEQTYFRFVTYSPTSIYLQIGTFQGVVGSYQAQLDIITSGYVTPGVWYYVTGVFDTNVWKIAINDFGFVATSSTSPSPFPSTSPVSIGSAYINTAYSRYFNGDISMIHVYNNALSAAQIGINYNNTRHLFE